MNFCVRFEQLCVKALQTLNEICNDETHGRVTIVLVLPVSQHIDANVGRYDFRVWVAGNPAAGERFVSINLVQPLDPPVLFSIAAEAAATQEYAPLLEGAFRRRQTASRQRCSCRVGGGAPCERLPPGARSADGRAWRLNNQQHEWLRSRLFPDVYGGVFVEVRIVLRYDPNVPRNSSLAKRSRLSDWRTIQDKAIYSSIAYFYLS